MVICDWAETVRACWQEPCLACAGGVPGSSVKETPPRKGRLKLNWLQAGIIFGCSAQGCSAWHLELKLAQAGMFQGAPTPW